MNRFLFALCAVVIAQSLPAQDVDRLKVGVQPDGRIVVPTNQVLSPAGKQVTFPGRPVDLLLLDDGKTVVLKNMKSLVFVEVATGAIQQTLVSTVPLSATGLLAKGGTVYVTDSDDDIRTAEKQADGSYKWGKNLALKKPPKGLIYPVGMAFLGDGEIAVAASRNNTIQIIDVKTRKTTQDVAVGVVPFGVAVAGGKIFASNWGGDMPKAGDPRAPSSGTDVKVDPKTGIANSGSVSVLTKTGDKWTATKSIQVGLHPSGMVASPDGKLVYVANANSDTVSVIDVTDEKVVETIACRPDHRLPFGSGTNALAISADGGTLFAANGTNNCVAVIRRRFTGPSFVAGLIPTGWFPGGIALTPDGKTICVANVKGHGSVDTANRPAEKGRMSKDHLGSLSLIPMPDMAKLAEYTKTTNDNNRLSYSLAGLEPARPGTPPAVVPARHGEPSPIEHVIYVIKENRTYDQVFGDMKEGNGDPSLVMFGENVTPNLHALARQFTLFDNFYCSGVLSADGHQWCNEAYVTDYLETAFGKFVRSYPYPGDDPLAFASSGFLWDNAMAKKKTFVNFGEFTKTKFVKSGSWSDHYAHFKANRPIPGMTVEPNVEQLTPYTKTNYPGFVMSVPDVYRARLFIAALKEYEKTDSLPNLIYIFLPCDHTSGTRGGSPKPSSMVADNDLAFGQIVEAVSHSKFWPKTCIFTVEDDPQNGFDHVDSHRTVALAISPYTKRKFVDSTCYNQTGMVKTMEMMLGLPPMNQLDLNATPMRNAFMAKPDLTPYKAVPNRTPLDVMNLATTSLKGMELHWAKKSELLDFSEADLADEDTLNRILWHSVHGEKPYPAWFVSPKEEEEEDEDDKPKKK